MAAHQTTRTTVEAYLRAERAASFRSEYVNGQVFAMAGGTAAHSVLIARLSRELLDATEDRGCIVSVTELRLRVSHEGFYTYPDLMVICGEVHYADDVKDMVTNPVVIVEVLSESTEAYDRGEKFAQYRRVASMQEYLLVSQHTARVEKYLRQPDGTWNYSSVEGTGSAIELVSLGCRLQLDRVYRNVPA